jgi:hypothetical protein
MTQIGTDYFLGTPVAERSRSHNMKTRVLFLTDATDEHRKRDFPQMAVMNADWFLTDDTE